MWYMYEQRRKVQKIRAQTHEEKQSLKFYELFEKVEPNETFAVKYFFFMVIVALSIATEGMTTQPFYQKPWDVFFVVSMLGSSLAYTFERSYEHYMAVHALLNI